MRKEFALVAVVASLVLVAVGAPTASAASNAGGLPGTTDAGPLVKVDVNGVAKNGKQLKDGKFGIYRFVEKGGKIYAAGTVTGTLKGRKVKRGNVLMPVDMDDSTLGSLGATTAQTGGTCQVLHLELGAIDLNLLGLRVKLGGGQNATDDIVLDITAQRGGGLLGDLLCGLADGIGGGGGPLGQLQTALQQLVAALNGILGLFGGGV